MLIKVTHCGVEYALDAPPEVCHRIQTDKCFASRYFQSILKTQGQSLKKDTYADRKMNPDMPSTSAKAPTTASSFNISTGFNNECLVAEDALTPVQPSAPTQSSTPSQVTSNTPLSIPPEPSTSTEPHGADESPVIAFGHKAVLLFLEECIKLKEVLRSCKIRRRHVFDKIAAIMQLHGYFFSSAALDKKLANLRTTYNKIRDNNNVKKRTGRGRMCWPYMEQMSSIYEYELNIADAPVVSSLQPTTPASSRPPYRPIRNSAALDDEGDGDDMSPSPKFRRRIGNTVREELMAVERRKVEIGTAMLEEIRRMSEAKEKNDIWDREMRSRQFELDKERLEFEKRKFEESKSMSK